MSVVRQPGAGIRRSATKRIILERYLGLASQANGMRRSATGNPECLRLTKQPRSGGFR